ncbi:hypothetical protein PanWU01x14_224820 [Parasponia andersonii]|uniref:Uncharacterized protein n=1 Tax=Parasponia andersonii TaxID=3476 RepID=A0A2P5BMZ5_PARAD|nr:hypothetical protein PanWU01x14_224820 [Parasponia andersonii]
MAIPLPDLSFLSSLVPLALKLDRSNYAFRRSQILPTVRAHELEGFLLGTHPCPEQFIRFQEGEGSSDAQAMASSAQRLNPAYTYWIRTDQALMSWLLASISESMLGHVVRCTSSAQLSSHMACH